jgi:hypothetical protein
MRFRTRSHLSGLVAALLVWLPLLLCASPAWAEPRTTPGEPAEVDAAKHRQSPLHLPARNWQTAPAIVDMGWDGEIYAIGDGHGDYERFTGLLVRAGLIASVPADPSAVEWTGGEQAVLVCTGDLIDKTPPGQPDGSLRLVRLMRQLQKVAPPGHVILTLGNHEAEFFAAPDSPKVRDFHDQLTGAKLSVDAVVLGEGCAGNPPSEACGLGEFLRNLPFSARVGRWFFAHAGNTRERTIAQLQHDLAADFDRAGFQPVTKDDPSSILEARLCSPKELKTLSDEGEEAACSWWGEDPKPTLRAATAALGVDHIVQGHQPGAVAFPKKPARKKGELFQRYGLIFLIDGGMSRNPKISKSPGGVLHIKRAQDGHVHANVLCKKKRDGIRIWSSDDGEQVTPGVLCP